MNCLVLGLFIGAAVCGLMVSLYHSGDARRMDEIRRHYEQELCHSRMALKALEQMRQEERGK